MLNCSIKQKQSAILLENSTTMGLPDVCQFWYTTSLFWPVKIHQKCYKIAQIGQKGQNFVFQKVHRLEKSTLSPVLAVVTNISYDHGLEGGGICAACFPYWELPLCAWCAILRISGTLCCHVHPNTQPLSPPQLALV